MPNYEVTVDIYGYETLEEIRKGVADDFESILPVYDSLRTNEERLRFLEDLSVLDLEDATNEQLRACWEDYFYPCDENGNPDPQEFINRMDVLDKRRVELQFQAGKDADSIMQSGRFKKDDIAYSDKCLLVIANEESAYKRMTHLRTNLQMNLLEKQEKAFAEEYCKEKGYPFTKDDGNNLSNAIGSGCGTKKFENKLMNDNPVENGRIYGLIDALDKTKTKKVWEFSPEEDKLYKENLKKRTEAEREQFREDFKDEIEYNKDLTVAQSVMRQLKAKRSWIFFGRESTEHAELVQAANTYQEKWQAYNDVRDKSPEDQIKAMKDLEEAAKEMQKKSSEYIRMKGSPKTPNGKVRLQGARNLLQMAQETQSQLGMWRDGRLGNQPEHRGEHKKSGNRTMNEQQLGQEKGMNLQNKKPEHDLEKIHKNQKKEHTAHKEEVKEEDVMENKG